MQSKQKLDSTAKKILEIQKPERSINHNTTILSLEDILEKPLK